MKSGGLSATPLKQLLLKNCGFSQTVPEAAAESIVLCAEQENRAPPTYYLDGQRDRVTGLSTHSTHALEERRIGGHIRVEGATIAYRIKDCVFSRGQLYTNRMRDNQGGKQARKMLFTVKDELETAVLPLSYFATLYFGHTLIDGGATALMAPEFGETYIDTQVHLGMAGHAARYWEIFGLSYTPVHDVRIKNAWVFDDLGMNTHKSARLKQMRDSLRALEGQPHSENVFVRRRGWGAQRAPENEAQLEEYFAARGFTILDASQHSVEEIVAMCRNAKVAVGVEGSGMAHPMLSMAQGTCVVMLFPPWRFNNMMKDYADGLGMHYGFVVGQGNDKHYNIDPDEVMRTIAMMPS